MLLLCGGDAAALVGFRPMLSKDASVTTVSQLGKDSRVIDIMGRIKAVVRKGQGE